MNNKEIDIYTKAEYEMYTTIVEPLKEKISNQEKEIKELKEQLQTIVNRIDLLTHDKDYRFLNDNGTWYSRESCKDLSFDEMFCEIDKELNNIECNEEEVLDLKAQSIQSLIDVRSKLYEMYYKQIGNKYYAELEDIENVINNEIRYLEEKNNNKLWDCMKVKTF